MLFKLAIFLFILLNEMSVVVVFNSKGQKMCILNKTKESNKSNKFKTELLKCSFEECKNEFKYKCGIVYCTVNEITCIDYFKYSLQKFGQYIEKIVKAHHYSEKVSSTKSGSTLKVYFIYIYIYILTIILKYRLILLF
jgi:hypothetical protein